MCDTVERVDTVEAKQPSSQAHTRIRIHTRAHTCKSGALVAVGMPPAALSAAAPGTCASVSGIKGSTCNTVTAAAAVAGGTASTPNYGNEMSGYQMSCGAMVFKLVGAA